MSGCGKWVYNDNYMYLFVYCMGESKYGLTRVTDLVHACDSLVFLILCHMETIIFSTKCNE